MTTALRIKRGNPSEGDFALPHQRLIDKSLWTRLVRRIVSEAEFNKYFSELDESEQFIWAERILNETLGFLLMYARSVSRTRRTVAWIKYRLGQGAKPPKWTPCSPSALVDLGWHVFIIYMKEYERFCKRLTRGLLTRGGIIYHYPSDEAGVIYLRGGVERTRANMAVYGVQADRAVWEYDMSSGGTPQVGMQSEICQDRSPRGPRSWLRRLRFW